MYELKNRQKKPEQYKNNYVLCDDVGFEMKRFRFGSEMWSWDGWGGGGVKKRKPVEMSY